MGDARNNYREPALSRSGPGRAVPPPLLAQSGTTGPRDTTDSIMSAYGAACDRVFEVRTLRRLTACVDEIT